MITADKLAQIIEAEVAGDGSLELNGVAKIESANPDEVSFVANVSYRKFLDTTRAGAVIVDHPPEEGDAVYLVTADPYGAFLKALHVFHPEPPKPEPGVHPTTVIGEDVKLGEGVSIGPLCVIEAGAEIGSGSVLRSQNFIGRNVTIGCDCLFHSRVSVREECRIGDRVILQDGIVIGSDGFGFAPQEMGYAKIPQVGIVVIEDDVEIGAGTMVDRATLGETRIRKGVKLDNLIQVAHNVDIGENTVIAGQSAIAGSTSLGKNMMIGGAVAVSGHLKISDGVKIAGKSGVHRNPGENRIVGGSPARDIREWRRIEASLSRLPDLFKRLRKLESGEEGEK